MALGIGDLDRHQVYRLVKFHLHGISEIGVNHCFYYIFRHVHVKIEFTINLLSMFVYFSSNIDILCSTPSLTLSNIMTSPRIIHLFEWLLATNFGKKPVLYSVNITVVFSKKYRTFQ